MASSNVDTTASQPKLNTSQQPPQTPVLTVQCRMLRSPSHESVTTDLSLFSVSSIASDAFATGSRSLRLVNFGKDGQIARGPSPNPECRIGNRPADIPEILWFEEETDLIRSCAALSSAVGLQKSFSTSDISQLPSPDDANSNQGLRSAVSELALNSQQRCGFLIDQTRLEHASRSCSTWVAVGDVQSTSQLPSPHGGHATSSTVANAGSTTGTTLTSNSIAPPQTNTPPPPAFTAADLIRSVNKKVRQNYIRRRLLTTYRAIERLSQSEFNLDRLEINASTAAASVPSEATDSQIHLTVPGASAPVKTPVSCPSDATSAAVLRVVKQRAGKNLPLTIRDVERERGKPLSKYERNMMIFNWLHTLDDSAFEGMQ